ncbi:MAG: hypothetical protein FWD66_03160 [Paludibacter sp.]|nr:hypothetical protein [Paludibacter sp.]
MTKKIICILFVALALLTCKNKDEQKIENAIREQLAKYPESRLQDIYKNFYQDCFSTGHAISDTAMVMSYLRQELRESQLSSVPLVEPIGWRHRFVRVNIDAVRNGMIDTAVLVHAFIRSASLVNPSDTANWEKEWATIIKIIEKNHSPIKDFQADKIMIDSLLRENPNRAMHHSRIFDTTYNPHYRVVESEIAKKILPN